MTFAHHYICRFSLTFFSSSFFFFFSLPLVEIKDGLKRMQVGPPEEHWCKLWARTLESKALSLESCLSYWAHPPLLQLANWDWDLDLRNTVTPLCNQCGPGGLTPMVRSSPYGVSFVGNVLHIQPCTTFPVDYLQECSPPVRNWVPHQLKKNITKSRESP